MPRLFCKEIAEDDDEKACLTKCDRDGEDDDEYGDDSTANDENDNTNQRSKEYTANDVINDKGHSSNSQTSFHVLNLIQGMGTLGIPYAIKVGGLASIVHIVAIAIITCYTSGLIIEAQYDQDSNDCEDTRPMKTRTGYAAIGDAVWTSYGSRIVSFVQLIHLLGACVLYLILVSNFLEGLFPKVLLTDNQCMLLAGVLVFPTAFLSNLSNIAWLSLTSIASLNIVFASLIFYSATEIRHWDMSSLPIASVDGTAISLCIILFSYVAHPYLPKIEGNMKKPQQFKYVINIAFTIATITKIVFGTSLACHYGRNTEQRVTNNIKNHNFKLVVDALLALSGLFSFAMPLNVILHILQKSDNPLFSGFFPIFKKDNKMTWSEKTMDLAMRVTLVCLSTFIAMLLPEFSLLMAIFGSVTALCLVIIFPIHFYSKLFKHRIGTLQLILNYTIVAVLIVVGASGFVYSLKALIRALKNSET